MEQQITPFDGVVDHKDESNSEIGKQCNQGSLLEGGRQQVVFEKEDSGVAKRREMLTFRTQNFLLP